jgi:hypothetical protein
VKFCPVIVFVDNFEKLEEDRDANAKEDKKKALSTTGVRVGPLFA